MHLSVEQWESLKHFSYYLVNGTLDYTLITETFGDKYYDILQNRPDLFYKTCCIYINQETKLSAGWPDTSKLGRFICQLYKDDIDVNEFEPWELDYTNDTPGLASDFKQFCLWFVDSKTVQDVSYKDYINSGATFVQQCFVIWANVVNLGETGVINQEHAIERVEQYIKSYFLPGYKYNLEEWEYEM